MLFSLTKGYKGDLCPILIITFLNAGARNASEGGMGFLIRIGFQSGLNIHWGLTFPTILLDPAAGRPADKVWSGVPNPPRTDCF